MSINSFRAAGLALVIGAIALPQFAAADDIENFVVQKAYDAAMSGDSETAMSMVTEDVFFTVLPPPGHPMWSQGP